jgi:hypothetical protein
MEAHSDCHIHGEAKSAFSPLRRFHSKNPKMKAWSPSNEIAETFAKTI